MSRASCWVWLAASIAGYVYVCTVLLHQPFHVGLRHLRYFDLRVYRGAGWRIAHHQALYTEPILRRLGFTYPPIAAILFVPLALFPLPLDEHIMVAIDVIALVFALRWTVSLACRVWPRVARTVGEPRTAWAVAAFAAGAALWIEPVTVTLGYGQVDLVIVALVVFDIARSDQAKTKGAAIGVAAGLKLTPLLFLPYLLFSGRRRAAVVGSAVFAATMGVGFVVDGHDAAQYWGGMFIQSSRVGPPADPGNQSLRAALSRLAGTMHPGAMTVLVVMLVTLAALVMAVRASRRGNEPSGYALCAIATLLASPVTWSHHWTLALPGILLLALLAYERRSPTLALGALALLAVGYGYLPQRIASDHTVIGGLQTLPEDPYVLLGLGVLIATAGSAAFRSDLIRARSRHRARRERSRPAARAAAPRDARPQPSTPLRGAPAPALCAPSPRASSRARTPVQRLRGSGRAQRSSPGSA